MILILYHIFVNSGRQATGLSVQTKKLSFILLGSFLRPCKFKLSPSLILISVASLDLEEKKKSKARKQLDPL